MLQISPRNRRVMRAAPVKRNSVSVIEGELKMKPCSPFGKDRFFTEEKKTPTKSPQSRPPPIPTAKKDSPYKSPISTPKKQKRFDIDDQVLDAPDIIDIAPNRILSFNSNGELGVALSDSVYIWRKNEDPEYFMQATNTIDALAWVNETSLVIATQGEVEIWNTQSKIQETNLRRHAGRVSCIEVKGNRVATAGTDKIINTTDLSKNQTMTLTGHHHEIVSISWSPDGVYLASCDKAGTLIIWGNSKKKRFHIDFPVSSITWVSQTIIAIGGSNKEGSLRFFNIICPEEETKTTVTGCPISSLQWCSKRGLLVAHRDSPYEWDIYGRDMNCIESFAGHSGDILNIASTNDGHCIATISIDEKLILWYIKDKKKALSHASSSAIFYSSLR